MKRHLGATLLIVLLVGIGGVVVWQYVVRTGQSDVTGGMPGEVPGVAVEVASISPGVLRDVRVLSGTLEAFTRFDVAARVGGLIQKIGVDLGDEIARGQVVASIDDAEYVQAVTQREAELAVRVAEKDQTIAELGRVQRDYERLQSLAERHAVSDVELDQITADLAFQKAALALAEARIRQDEAALELARIQLGYAQVRAVWDDGPDFVTVGERYEDAGNTVQVGNPVLGVVALDPLRVVVSITERDYTRLRVGQSATLTTDAVPGQAFSAEIVRISPIFREASRQARIELRVENPEHVLKPGMFARVSLVLRDEPAETVVPLDALTRRDGQSIVFVIPPGAESVRMIPVDVGIVDGDRVGIAVAGKVEGDSLVGRVVTLGQQLLTEGSLVRVYTPTARETTQTTTEPVAEDAGQ